MANAGYWQWVIVQGDMPLVHVPKEPTAVLLCLKNLPGTAVPGTWHLVLTNSSYARRIPGCFVLLCKLSNGNS